MLTLFRMDLPGPGTIYLGQDLRFRKFVAPGQLDTHCSNRQGEEVLTGTAAVISSAEKVSSPRISPPELTLRRHDRFERFLRDAHEPPQMTTAAAHLCSAQTIRSAIEARDEGLIESILVGLEHKIRAEQAGVSLAGLQREATEHSHAITVGAVDLAAAGEVDASMKGSLLTDELLRPVAAAQSGLRSERLTSNVYALDVPDDPRSLIVTDAAIDITSTLEQIIPTSRSDSPSVPLASAVLATLAVRRRKAGRIAP